MSGGSWRDRVGADSHDAVMEAGKAKMLLTAISIAVIVVVTAIAIAIVRM